MSDELDIEKHEDASEKGSIVLEERLGYTISVERKDLLKAASGLKEAGFDLFQFVTAVDYPDAIKLTYRVFSSRRKNQIAVFIKTEVPKDDPTIDSLTSVWPAANWHERETYDLFGIEFIDHPNLKRIFMPDDWKGHPLRKDYTDDRIIVMDDGKKEKPAVAPKEKPVAKAEKAEIAAAPKPDTAAAAKETDASAEAAKATPAEASEQAAPEAARPAPAGEAPAQPEATGAESEKATEEAPEEPASSGEDTKADS